MDFHYDQVRPGFNEQRDYLYFGIVEHNLGKTVYGQVGGRSLDAVHTSVGILRILYKLHRRITGSTYAEVGRKHFEEGPYKLYSTNKPDEDYLNMFAAEDANKDEYILAIRFSFATKLYHNATAASLVASQGRPGFTRKAVNMYLMKDGTRFTARLMP